MYYSRNWIEEKQRETEVIGPVMDLSNVSREQVVIFSISTSQSEKVDGGPFGVGGMRLVERPI